MNRIVLDPRDKRELMELIARRAAQYTPEWRFEGGTDDPGAAIATLFGELFSQTVERFNLLPEKYYTEFLNLLGTPPPTVTPAEGYLQFEAADAGSGPVAVPAGTEAFAAAEDENDEDVVFSTQRRVEATMAQLEGVYFADAAEERIELVELDGEKPFFAPTGAVNLQKHRFSIRQNEALRLSGPCTVEVTLRQSARFLEDATAKTLADPSFAAWLYYDGADYVPFDSVKAENGVILLEKRGSAPFAPEEDGNRYLYCDARKGASGSVTVAGAALRVRPGGELSPDSMAGNDVPIDRAEGGYCFSRKPSAYEAFYMRSDEVFCKRGAFVKVRFDIVPIVTDEVGDAPQYEFNKRIIDKTDAVKIVPDDVFVERVVWEYHNGRGWAPLGVGGNANPFSCRQAGQGELTLTFAVPGDMSPSEVNAQEGYHIRARVVNVENFLSARPRWLSPFIKDAACTFEYPLPVRAEALRAQNNADTVLAEDGGADDLRFTAFTMMENNPPCMYLCFSSSPHAMPLSILFRVAGEAALPCKILFEAWNGKGFERVRCVDQTRNLRYTGTVSLYLSEPVPQSRLFAREGFWLRMSLSAPCKNPASCPHVTEVRLNITNAIQRQRAPEQVFSTGPYDANKTLELPERPIQRAEVWVDEANGLTRAQIEAMAENEPGRVRMEEGEDGPRFWVRWEEIGTLAQAQEGERVYELDRCAGTVRFGSGRDGRVPPQGELNIKIQYDYGGGARGNLAESRVNALVGSIPLITGVRNITPMGGGTDKPAPGRTESLGNSCIRHRGRALGAFDYEHMTMARFQKAARVKCFPNTDQNGKEAPGHVCVVVMEQGAADERATAELCREIYDYLSERSDCNLVSSGRLHVTPSMEIAVSARVLVQVSDLDQAAVTQQQIADNIAALVERAWRAREIGAQIRPLEVYQAVKATPNVRAVTRILLEGSYYRDGRRRLCSLDEGAEGFPFATVRNGSHTVRIG